MKKHSIIYRFVLATTCGFLAWMLPDVAYGQGDRARIQLEYFNINNTEHQLVATVKTKDGPSYVNVPDVPVHFYLGAEDGISLGTDTSDARGRAVAIIPKDAFDTSTTVVCVAVIRDHSRFEDYSRDIEIQPASMSVGFDTDSTGHRISVLLEAPDSSGSFQPVADVGVKVYVQRMFGELPVSLDFNVTGENGRTGISFPDDIPGDPAGHLDIVVKVPDHELYGSLVHRESVKWGIPGEIEKVEISRRLWSARMNAPVYLIVIVNALLAGVWLTIGYIIFNLVRLSKLNG